MRPILLIGLPGVGKRTASEILSFNGYKIKQFPVSPLYQRHEQINTELFKNPRIVIQNGFHEDSRLIHLHRGVIIHITRNTNTSTFDSCTFYPTFYEPDYIIDNNGTIKNLESLLFGVMRMENLVA